MRPPPGLGDRLPATSRDDCAAGVESLVQEMSRLDEQRKVEWAEVGSRSRWQYAEEAGALVSRAGRFPQAFPRARSPEVDGLIRAGPASLL